MVQTLLKLSVDENAKTYADSRCLLTSVCDFEIVFGLNVLKLTDERAD